MQELSGFILRHWNSKHGHLQNNQLFVHTLYGLYSQYFNTTEYLFLALPFPYILFLACEFHLDPAVV